MTVDGGEDVSADISMILRMNKQNLELDSQVMREEAEVDADLYHRFHRRKDRRVI